MISLSVCNQLIDKGIPLYTSQFYGACAVGGTLACGVTHWLVTPLDLVKCRRQVNLIHAQYYLIIDHR